jgi:hypothetical protein
MATANPNLRKHYKSMSQEEIAFIRKAIGNADGWNFGQHAIDQMLNRNALIYDVVSCFSGYNVIEYHTYTGEPRVLIRANGRIRNQNICVVIAPKRRAVITVYFNDATDRHSTIDWHQYTKSLNVLTSWNA